MRMAIMTVAAMLAASSAFAQAQFQVPGRSPALATPRVTGTRGIGLPYLPDTPQSIYLQNQQVLQGEAQDNARSEQQIQTLSEHNQEMLQTLPAPAESRLR
jgi:hypothetical protein